MKHIKFKIREHFISLTEKGIKKHEYRLADPKSKNINVGDILILVSNQNENNYVKVIVDAINKYPDWKSALQNYWQEDFNGLFSSFNDVLKECYRFYPKENVDKYGIEVLSIRPYKKKFSSGRYLFDTNTIIERESSNNVSPEVSLCYLMIDKLKGDKFIHPHSIKEINGYQDEKIKSNILIKLESYQKLIPISEKNDYFDEICSNFSMDENSLIDNEILLQVFNGNVDFLITSDRAIIKKAKKLYIADRVFTPNSFLNEINTYYPQFINYPFLSVRLTKIGKLNINDSFFDSLREDYGGAKFNDWLRRKSNEDAYVFEEKGNISGFLYLKIENEDENYSHFSPKFSPAQRLKVGTFKITKTNLRLGERFLQIIFDNARKNKVDEVYVTLFEDKRDEVKRLRNLLEEWGFVKKATNINNGEIVLVKSMKKYLIEKSPKFNYPLQKEEKSYMFLPIMAQYHTKLFPDLYLKSENIKIFDELACRYAIEKIYVSGYKKIDANPGDIMLVYRMSDYNKTYKSVVSGLAILNEVKYPSTISEFIKECKDKSVFTEKELINFYNNDKYQTVIKVLFLKSFSNKVNLKTLKDCGIIDINSKGPRVNSFISKEKFNKLMELGNSDEE
ncbi:MAG: hypothetical protein SO253_01080 [Bacilli bacterium]|nr:hypothetical protein [Bacilli bacterium]